MTSEYVFGGTTPLASFAYAARDGLGRITELDESILGGTEIAWEYVYDAAGRLSEVWRDGVLERSYAYDPSGNRLSATDHAADPDETVEGAYDNQDRLRRWGDLVFTYGANGELATRTADHDPEADEVTSYAYDLLGSLKSVVLPDATLIEYVVDGLGRRIGKVVGSALDDEFYYADGLSPVAWIDGNGDAARFVYGTRGTSPDYMEKGGATYRIVSDHLGSPRLVVNADTGAVMQRTDYDAFGRATDVTVASGWEPIPIGFAGGLYDRDTGLVRFGARDYDPETGRWTAKDPILFAGGDGNLYGYVLGDPVNETDAFGLYSAEELLRDYGNLASGFADTLTGGFGLADLFGLPSFTEYYREQAGLENFIDKCSAAYEFGEYGGYAWGIGASWATAEATLYRLGWRWKLAVHGPHHEFGALGRLSHIQLNAWKTGVKASGKAIRIPLPWR